MLPRALRAKYSLTHAQMAVLLAKDVRTVERYCHGNFPTYIETYGWLLDNYLSTHGSPPPTIWGMSQ